ncbi:DUF3142 domain-containing protein [Aestuariivirga litoralis]|uniref:DUF3142 domain-containing protein n=1 Tax=Aestuariivirga litoralis TaxID=2650924 RepID=UPI0018C6EFA8
MSAQPVSADDYRAFWLWSGVTPKPALAKAQEVFLLAGEVTARGITSQRGATPRVKTSKVWIVYRVQTLDWPPGAMENILRHVAAWQDAGNDMAGLQIDFDSGTRNLGSYVAFLRDVRAKLPSELKLGITGLLDWGANARAADLAALHGVVDEVILQIYQGRRVIPGYQNYLVRLQKLNVPFRVGLLEGGGWSAPGNLAADPMFRGYVVFLVNGAGR